MNLPNKLTLTRIILLFPLVILFWVFGFLMKQNSHNYYVSGRILLSLMLLIFIGAMITDFFDGYIARKRNLVTSFGKLWDPLADKLIVSSTLIAFAAFGFVPVWIVIIFVARDIVVDGFRIVMVKNNVEVAASKWGKLKTLTQTIAIGFLFVLSLIFPFWSIEWYSAKMIDFVIFQVCLYVINIPTIVALVFSIISGSLYYKSIRKYIRVK